MSARKRVKRPVSERAEPARSWTGAFRSTSEGEPRTDQSAPGGAQDSAGWAAARDASYEAVNGGYRVIDEYMRQGQRFAEEFWLPSAESTGGVPDFSRMMERFLKSAGDMGTAWLEMMTERARPPATDMGPRGTAGPFTAGRTNGHPASHRAPAGSPEGTGFSVAVESSKRVRVSVDATIRLNDVEVHPLVSSDRKLPPITTATVEVDPASGDAILRVTVSDDQPAGTYHGVLLHRPTERPAGTITLVVH